MKIKYKYDKLTHHCCIAQYALENRLKDVELISEGENIAKVYKVHRAKKTLKDIYEEVHRATKLMEEIDDMNPSNVYDYDIVYTTEYILSMMCLARDILHKYSEQSED